jgi:hypothetical protein
MNVKWLTLENSTGERTLKQHAFIHKVKKRQYTREEYDGNVALCCRSFASEDGEVASSFESLDSEEMNPEKACKICMKTLKQSN